MLLRRHSRDKQVKPQVETPVVKPVEEPKKSATTKKK